MTCSKSAHGDRVFKLEPSLGAVHTVLLLDAEHVCGRAGRSGKLNVRKTCLGSGE